MYLLTNECKQVDVCISNNIPNGCAYSKRNLHDSTVKQQINRISQLHTYVCGTKDHITTHAIIDV